jgi:tetratricopeptide (TPR) repeat protein
VLERIQPQAYEDDREIGFLWEKLALLRISLQDYVGALEAYRMAVQTERSQWLRQKPLGYLETEVGHLGNGIRILERYLEKAPNDGEGWLFLGDAFARRGDFGQAREAWLRFLELEPEMPEAPRVRENLRRIEESSREDP